MPAMKSTTTQWKEVCALSAIELARRISSRKLTAGAALDAHLACIEGRNPQLNAVVSLDIAGARRQADAVDDARPPWITHGEIGHLQQRHTTPALLRSSKRVATRNRRETLNPARVHASACSSSGQARVSN